MKFGEFIGYVISQILGAIVGGIAIFGIAKMANFTMLGDACNLAAAFSPDAGASLIHF